MRALVDDLLRTGCFLLAGTSKVVCCKCYSAPIVAVVSTNDVLTRTEWVGAVGGCRMLTIVPFPCQRPLTTHVDITGGTMSLLTWYRVM